MDFMLKILIISMYVCSCSYDAKFIKEKKIKGSKLRFRQSPANEFTFDQFKNDIIIEIIDDDGNIALEDDDIITISIENDASNGNASINGILQLKAVAGVATFDTLSIDYPASNYTLKATAKGLQSAISDQFNVKNWGVQYGAVTTPNSNSLLQDNTALDRCEFGAIDNDGFIYCGGYTDGNFISENAGAKDVFYVKVDPNTLEQVDSFQLGKETESSPLINSLAGDEFLAGIEVDSEGNIYLIGYTTSDLAETAQGNDAFVVKLDKHKNILWVKHFGSSTKVISSAPSNSNLGSEIVEASSIDEQGNIYFAGYSSGDYILTSYTTNTNYPDAVVVKLDKDGNTLWARQFGENLPTNVGESHSKDIIRDIVVNGEYLYFAGDTNGNWIEDNVNVISKQDIFFGKIAINDGASDCSNCYLNQIGTQSQSTYPFIINAALQDIAYSVSADDEGNIYIGASTRGDFAVNKVLGNPTGTSDPFDPVVIKADASGTLQWAYQSGEANLPTPCDPLPSGATPCATDSTELISKILVDNYSNSYLLFRTQADQYVDLVVGDTYDSMILILDKDGATVGENLGIFQFSGDRLLPEVSNSGTEVYLDMIINNEYLYIFGMTDSDSFENSSGSFDSIIFRNKLPLN